MRDKVVWLPATLVETTHDLDREFDARLTDSSALAIRVAFSVLRNQADAEDVAQEAFAKAHRSFAQLRDRDRFRAWLVRMTWRMATGAQGNSPRAVETTRTEMTFRNVGTDIDTQVTRTDESTFAVYVSIRDSAIFSADPSKPPTAIADPTAFRTFNTSNTLPMKDGQTRLFGLATDKITGETMRIEVKLTVLK